MRLAAFGVVAVALLAAVVPASADTASADPGRDATQVAYVNYDITAKRSTVVLTTLDGERQVLLDRPDLLIAGVEWSPTGDALAFGAATGPSSTQAVYRLDLATGDVTRLTPLTSQSIRAIVWSHDGSQLAYSMGQDVHIVRRNGTDDRTVAKGSEYVGGSEFDCGGHNALLTVANWTPDDMELLLSAFESCFEIEHADIAIVRVDGTGFRELVETGGNEEMPTLSPDGNQIAFDGLRVVNRDGTGLHTVAAGGVDPTWNHRGDLAFTQAVYDEAQTGVIDRDVWAADPAPRALAVEASLAGLPRWSADDAAVGYLGIGDDGARLLAVPVEGGTPTLVSAPSDTNVLWFDFRPPANNSVEPSTRLAGDDRYATAAAIARAVQQQRTTPSRVAILARGDDFPDGLTAANLGTLPLLLTLRDSLHPAAAAALQDLGVDTIIIIGGTSAVGADVEQDLREAGYSVERRQGSTRYETGAATFDSARAAGIDTLGGLHTVIVASGEAFPDALAAGPLAARERLPILLTGRDHLPPATIGALDRCDECEQALIVGGPDAVAPTVEAELRAHGLAVRRVAGATRQATAAAVAALATDELGWSVTQVTIARGDAYPDALAAAPLGALMRAPTLLTTSMTTLGTPGRRFIYDHRDKVMGILALGDTTAVSSAAELEARRTAA